MEDFNDLEEILQESFDELENQMKSVKERTEAEIPSEDKRIKFTICVLMF